MQAERTRVAITGSCPVCKWQDVAEVENTRRALTEGYIYLEEEHSFVSHKERERACEGILHFQEVVSRAEG